MRNSIYLIFCFVVIAITTVSCSSDDSEPVYDNVLSNTIWMQSNTDNGGDGPISNPSLPTPPPFFEAMYNRLQYDILNTEDRNDTTWHIDDQKQYYILRFKNNTCELNNVSIKSGTYYIESKQVQTRHYPNQTISDASENFSCEITVRDDSIIYTYKRPYVAPVTTTFFLGENNIKDETIKTYFTTEDYPGAKEETKQYNMTFTRNGLNIELNGDLHLVGVLNTEGDIIEFNGLGTLQRTTADSLPINII